MISTKDFDFEPASRTLSAEASTILGRHPEENLGTYVTIKSEHTGKVIKFRFQHAIKDEEGDIVSWLYKPAQGEDANPNLKVVIYND